MRAMQELRERLRELIQSLALQVAEEERFELASGRRSRYFFDLKPVTLHPEGSAAIAELMLERLVELEVEFAGGPESGAIPIVASVCTMSHLKGTPVQGFYVRKQRKSRGTERLIEGNLRAGARAAVLEDVTTTGSSALRAVQAAKQAGARVETVLCVVDRQEGAEQALEEQGIELWSIFKLADFGLR